MTDERRLKQITSMKRAYPSLDLVSDWNEASLIWEGWLQPIRSTDELDSLLDDLERDRDVDIVRGESYTLAHNPECPHEHGKHRLREQIPAPPWRFKLRIQDFNDGRLPCAHVLEPVIPVEERRHHRGPDGICSFAPWEYPWDKNDSEMVEFTDQALIWLFKQTVYSQTEHWLGRETAHDTRYLLTTLKATSQCHCGSGKNYADCHRPQDGKELYGDIWIFFEAWLITHKEYPVRFITFMNYLPRHRSPRFKAHATNRR